MNRLNFQEAEEEPKQWSHSFQCMRETHQRCRSSICNCECHERKLMRNKT